MTPRPYTFISGPASAGALDENISRARFQPQQVWDHALCIAPKAGVAEHTNETHPSVYSACRRPRYASHLLPTILPHVKHLTGMIISALRLQRHKQRVKGCAAPRRTHRPGGGCGVREPGPEGSLEASARPRSRPCPPLPPGTSAAPRAAPTARLLRCRWPPAATTAPARGKPRRRRPARHGGRAV